MKLLLQKVFQPLTLITLVVLCASSADAQETKWMSVGSLHSWYSSMGCEIEEGRVKVQQDGLRWPALYKYQDMEAAKALWVAVSPYTYPDNTVAPYVVHVGPRVTGTTEFFPVTFEMISKYSPTEVTVDGVTSETPGESVDNNSVDPSMKPDRMIVNVVNTATGITMTRKIMQVSQQYHDNYFIYDYVFKNTGNTDGDAEIEKPNQTLNGVYFYWTYRYAVCADTRFVIGQNPTGWGINTMNDARGDGNSPTPDSFFPGNKDSDIRAQYSWHGKYPPFTLYDNIGAPIWTPYYDKTDTIGRLGSPQFVGNATILANKSATDTTDDLAQPTTMSYEGSDEPNTSQNDAKNPVKNTSEYAWITRGRVSPRHADKVGPTGDPSIGLDGKTTPGGQSNASGYGPYTLKPGDSVHVVIVEATAGLSREAGVEIGRAWRATGGNVSALITYKGVSKTKNDWVYTGRDSLFQTFRRALANYRSGFGIPEPPAPPSTFSLNSGAGRVRLEWSPSSGGAAVKSYEIWRAVGRYDSTYHLLASVGPSVTSYDDTTAQIDVAHYYYLVAVGDPADNNKPGLNPGGALISGRYYTQTYDAAYRRVPVPPAVRDSIRSARATGKFIRIVPNPYNVSSDANLLRYPGEPDKITFKNLPERCTIKIYTELGELINRIDFDDTGGKYGGTYDWYQTTSSKQIVVSGVYIVVVDTPSGVRAIQKFVVIR